MPVSSEGMFLTLSGDCLGWSISSYLTLPHVRTVHLFLKRAASLDGRRFISSISNSPVPMQQYLGLEGENRSCQESQAEAVSGLHLQSSWWIRVWKSPNWSVSKRRKQFHIRITCMVSNKNRKYWCSMQGVLCVENRFHLKLHKADKITKEKPYKGRNKYLQSKICFNSGRSQGITQSGSEVRNLNLQFYIDHERGV